MNKMDGYRVVAWIALILALCVIMLGTYTRLTNAGLGCLDWPGCYGKLVLTQSQHMLSEIKKIYPTHPIALDKTWPKMAHRYIASLLGLLIVSLLIMTLLRRKHHPNQTLWPSLLLFAVIIFQAALGMWAVTLLLLPLVFMSHLLGGMTIAALLCWILNSSQYPKKMTYNRLSLLKVWGLIGLIILAVQIFLGAWTSTNYAALVCPDFPYCQGTFFPHMNWYDAFNFARPVGPIYKGGQLAMAARMTIQMAHRFGAAISFIYIFSFSMCLILMHDFSSIRKLGILLMGLLILQVLLGISDVVFMLPLLIAVAHNGIAALMLLTMVTILYRIYMTDPRQWIH